MGLTLAGVARPHVAIGRGGLAALGLAAAATLALAAALPLLATMALTGGLRQTLTTDVHVTVQRTGVADFDGFARFQQEAERRVRTPMGSYLDGGTPFATTGPLYTVSLNGSPAPAAIARVGLSAGFLDDLTGHVEVLAGALPPDGLGGDATAVSMPQEGADQIGLHISDRFCVDFAPNASRDGRWCGRIVALWAPLRRSDPYWGGAPPKLQLTLGRYDFFQLLRLRSQQGAATAAVGRRYAADPVAVEPGTAPDAQERIAQVGASLGGQPDMRLTENLGAALRRFDGQRHDAFAAFGVAGAVLVLLGLSLVSLTTRRFLAMQARDVAILRARGWSLGQVWRLLLVQIGAPVAVGVPLGLALAALAIVAVGPDGQGTAIGASVLAVGTALVGMTVALGLPAVTAASREAGQGGRDASRPELPWWRRSNVDLLAALTAVPLLALPHVDLPDAGLRPLAPGLAVALLGLLALRALPIVGAVSGGEDVPRALARWQLSRRPGQHGGTALRVTLALAVTVFGAIALGVGPRLAGPAGSIQSGWSFGLVATALTATVMALVGFGLHFAAVARERDREYAILTVNGLPGWAVRQSVGSEEAAVLVHGCFWGTVLGVALAVDIVPLGEIAPSIGVGAAAASAALTIVVLALVTVAWAARRRAGLAGPRDALRVPR